jgi:hypothetical protein
MRVPGWGVSPDLGNCASGVRGVPDQVFCERADLIIADGGATGPFRSIPAGGPIGKLRHAGPTEGAGCYAELDVEVSVGWAMYSAEMEVQALNILHGSTPDQSPDLK